MYIYIVHPLIITRLYYYVITEIIRTSILEQALQDDCLFYQSIVSTLQTV